MATVTQKVRGGCLSSPEHAAWRIPPRRIPRRFRQNPPTNRCHVAARRQWARSAARRRVAVPRPPTAAWREFSEASRRCAARVDMRWRRLRAYIAPGPGGAEAATASTAPGMAMRTGFIDRAGGAHPKRRINGRERYCRDVTRRVAAALLVCEGGAEDRSRREEAEVDGHHLPPGDDKVAFSAGDGRGPVSLCPAVGAVSC